MPTICDILPGTVGLLDLPVGDDRLDLRARVGQVRRVALVLVDGMGYHLLPEMAPHAPLLAAVLAGERGWLTELSCTFPSTTPTSLASFTTGSEAGEHGILGFTLKIPGTDRVLTHIGWRDDPPPAQWQPMPTWFERMRQAGANATAVLPEFFAGSGLTEAVYRGAEFRGVGRHDDYAGRLLTELHAEPGLVYGYVSTLDTAAHAHGIASAQWAEAAAGVDALLSRLLDGLPGDAALLVTADHGGLDVAPDARVDVATDADLADGVRIVTGEPRVRYLHTADGAHADVRAAWKAVLGDRAQVLLRDEAIESGWFGPVRDEHRARIGDVVTICTDEFAVLATEHEPAETAKLVGFHGGATPMETAIPLIALRR